MRIGSGPAVARQQELRGRARLDGDATLGSQGSGAGEGAPSRGGESAAHVRRAEVDRVWRGESRLVRVVPVSAPHRVVAPALASSDCAPAPVNATPAGTVSSGQAAVGTSDDAVGTSDDAVGAVSNAPYRDLPADGRSAQR